MDFWKLKDLERWVAESQQDVGIYRLIPARELPHLPEHREAGKRAADQILHNEADAAEAADQAVLEIAAYPNEPANTRAAIVQRSQQRAKDIRRKRNRQRTEVNTDTANSRASSDSLSPLDRLEAAEYFSLLESAIATLPPEDRPASTLYFRHYESVREICDTLDCGYQVVYRTLQRSRPKLHRQLPEEYREHLRPFPDRSRTRAR